jgi:hypothetical protein
MADLSFAKVKKRPEQEMKEIQKKIIDAIKA